MGVCVCPAENRNLESELVRSQQGPKNVQEVDNGQLIESKENKIEIEDKQLDESKPIESKSRPLSYKERFDQNLHLLGAYAEKDELQQCISRINGISNASSYSIPETENGSELHKMDPVKFTNCNIYDGQWNDQFQMEGQGEIYLFDETTYAKGIWKQGAFIQGRVHFPNGSFYEGAIKDSKFNGKGVLTNADGTIYKGEFEDGKRQGDGQLIFPDGSCYTGSFERDNVTGKGEFTWADKTTFKGSFSDSMLEGFGVLSNKNGSCYEGNFSNNLFNGKGKFTWSTGDFYEGEYRAGIKEGKGIFCCKDYSYDGSWRDNLPHGAGKVKQGEVIYESYWRNGNCIETPDQINSYEQNSAVIQPITFSAIIEDINPAKLKYLENEIEKNPLATSKLLFFSPSEQINYD